MTGIYKISNSINSKIYIGSAVDFRLRKNRHITQLNRKIHCNKKLQRFCDKYGVDKLIFEIIEICEKHELLIREQFYLDKYNSVKDGFNICPTAGSWLNANHSNKTKKKISSLTVGNKYCLGRILSEETKNKIRQKALGRKQSKKTIQKRVKKNIGKKRPISAIEATKIKTSKLNESQIRQIRNMLENGIYQKIIAERFGVCQRNISRIKQGISYTHIK